LVRRGYTDSAVSATVTTADDSATAGRDYQPITALVAFAPGEVEKFVQIPLLNDGAAEADEVVQLGLTANSAEVVLPRPTAPLWILDDERAGSVNPALQLKSAGDGTQDSL
jgi:hypothetical protein